MKSVITIHIKNFQNVITILMLGILLNSSTKTNAQCTAHFTFDNSQNNGNVYFQDSSTYTGQIMRFVWDLGDGSTNHQQYFSHTYIAGTYNVCLSISDSLDLSCTSTYCDSITVLDSNATCSGSFYSVDSSGGTFFNPSISGNATDYFWDFGDGTTSTLLNPGIHVYSGNGSHTVCFTASNPSTACSFTYCDSTFLSSCGATVSFVHDSVGSGVTFTSTVTGGANTYSWNFGDGSTSSLANPNHVFSANGYYHVCLTVSSSSDSTCLYTSCLYVQINSFCDANFTVVQDSLNLSHFWIFNSSTSSSNMDYGWSFGDGDSSTIQYPSHSYATSGPYNLCLTISDNFGCMDQLCDSVQAVFRSNNPMSISVIDPLTAGIVENTSLKTKLENYPNPFNGSTTITYTISSPAFIDLILVDILGNKIASIEKAYKQAGKYTTTWNADGVSNGLYLLKLRANEFETTKKIIITR